MNKNSSTAKRCQQWGQMMPCRPLAAVREIVAAGDDDGYGGSALAKTFTEDVCSLCRRPVAGAGTEGGTGSASGTSTVPAGPAAPGATSEPSRTCTRWPSPAKSASSRLMSRRIRPMMT